MLDLFDMDIGTSALLTLTLDYTMLACNAYTVFSKKHPFTFFFISP